MERPTSVGAQERVLLFSWPLFTLCPPATVHAGGRMLSGTTPHSRTGVLVELLVGTYLCFESVLGNVIALH